ncbi:hypothetical protein QN277_009118 [Acacia crassicarpa]|uniref:Uncharacterized protein n=1 Tax=Acacia crassicarpa TaxID=499986 RepID=A0AAE1M8X5_9FABA|nr:hypothetical protein QN277_009118 [Acacia crassicarpa]
MLWSSSYTSSSSSKPEQMEIETGDAFPTFAAFPASEGGMEGEDYPIPEEEESSELSESTFKGDRNKVVELYQKQSGLHISVINSSRDTALHMAISDDREDVVEKLVKSIVDYHNKKALMMQNNRDETPLHRAATRKSVKMCECIVKAGQHMGLDLLSITNKWGETPIFTAALHDSKLVFIFLHDAAEDAYPRDTEKPYQFLGRTDGSGDTALHSAIGREHFELAFHMMKLYPDLMGRSNVKGITPLHVLASKPSAFRSGLPLSWWKQIIYYCIDIRVDKGSATKQEDRKIKGYWSRQAKSSGGELGGKSQTNPYSSMDMIFDLKRSVDS